MHRMIAFVGLLAAAAPAVAVRVEVVLDVSGSMAAAAGATTRMAAARQAVEQTAAAIPPDSMVGLRLYGHRVDKADRAASCRDTELVIPFGPVDVERFAAAVDDVEPRGQTPLAHSLEQAAADLAGSDEAGVVVLVSDGEESCGGDPRAVACRLAAGGLALTVHTVGFAVDAAARRQLEQIAACTGGEYRDARDAASLADSLHELVQASLVLDRERQAEGEETRGGEGFASAVELTPGALYRLDHHQKRNQEDYFAVDAAPGQKLVASIQAHEAGIAIRGDRAREQEHQSCAGIAVHGPDRQRIVSRWGYRPGQEVGLEVPLGEEQGGRFFVLVGPLGCPGDQHKDSRFRVALADLFDAASGGDAGARSEAAVPIAAGDHRGWLHANDDRDYFRFDAAERRGYGVALTPAQDGKHLQLTVYDRDGRRVARAGHQLDLPGTILRLGGLRLPPGTSFVEVATHPTGRWKSGKLESAYALTLTEEGPAAAAADAPGRRPGAAAAAVPPLSAAAGIDPPSPERAAPGGGGRLLALALIACLGGVFLLGAVVALRFVRR